MPLNGSSAFPTHLKTTISSHTGPVHCVKFSEGAGQYILSGSSDRTIHLSNPAKKPSSSTSSSTSSSQQQQQQQQQLIQTYSGAHSHEVLDLAISTDNASFASVGGDKLVYLWDVTSARTVRRWSGHFGRVNAVVFGGDHDNNSGGGGGGGGAGAGSANLVISGSYDASVRIWDIRAPSSTRAVQVLDEAGDSVTSLLATSFSTSTSTSTSTSALGGGEHTAAASTTAAGHSSSGRGSSGAGAGAEIMTGSVDGRVRTYDLRMGILYTDVVGGSTAAVTSLSLTRDASALLVSTLDDSIRLMDKSDGKCLMRYGSSTSPSTSSGSGSGAGSGPGSGSTSGVFRNRELRIRSCLGQGDRFVVSGGEDGGVYAWDLLGGPPPSSSSSFLSSSSSSLSSSSTGLVAKIDNAHGGKVVSCVAWNGSDGRRKQWVSGGMDGKVRVWGAAAVAAEGEGEEEGR